MDSQNRLESGGEPQSRRKSPAILMIVIFVLGVIVGVVGLCAAFKLIFYIGLAVIILAAIAILWLLLRK